MTHERDADRDPVGNRRLRLVPHTLLITVGTYAVFTVACGFATSYEMLLVFRGLQGLGFGGEWAAGAVLVAEYCSPRHRGRALAWVQSAWAVGWASP